MKKFFTAANIIIILAAFFIGQCIIRYEDRFGFPALSEKIVQTEKKAIALPPATQEDSTGKININTAVETELCELDGIGKKLAERIVAYRSENGSFTVPEDILKVSGIGPGIFEKNKDRICVN